jgi:adenylate cyclase
VKLIDGPPDAGGRSIARRAMLLTVPAVLAAKMAGAVGVFVLVVWVLPLPELGSRDDVLIVNLVAASAYVLLAAVVGTMWGLGRWRTTRDWLVHDRDPDDEERRATLRVPLRQLEVSLVLWGIAVAPA